MLRAQGALLPLLDVDCSPSGPRRVYVTFNKSIAKQAELVFPSNVICKTFHSMAYGHIGRK